MMRMRLLIIIPILIFIFGGCVQEKDEPVWALCPGERLPEFEITLNTGEVINTQSLKRKRSVIIFFSTTCPDCRRMLPEYQRWYDEIQETGEEVNFFCISRAEDDFEVRKYWQENEFMMPYSAQPTRAVYDLFASAGIPRVFIADADLTIIESRLDE